MCNTMTAIAQIYIRICPELINTATLSQFLCLFATAKSGKFMLDSQINVAFA